MPKDTFLKKIIILALLLLSLASLNVGFFFFHLCGTFKILKDC